MTATQRQPDLFDPAVMARALRDEGMARAAAKCSTATLAAQRALEALSRRQPLVHIDDFIPVLETLQEKPSPNAMGSVWRWAKENFVLEETGAYRPCTKHARKHAHKYPVYRSLVFKTA